MDTLTFLRKVLPDSGYYFADLPSPSGYGFMHNPCTSLPELAAKVLHIDNSGYEAYFACSSFKEPHVFGPDPKDPTKTKKRYRIQSNAKLVKAFWLDLDVSPPQLGAAPAAQDKKYTSQQEAVLALGNFIREAGFPKPMVVSSGYGVHVYWPLTDTLLPGTWKAAALKLKSLCVGLDLHADPSRTSDEASVLRPVGTTNRKRKEGKVSEAPVYLISDADPTEPDDFIKRLDAALKVHGLKAPVARGPATGVNPVGITVQRDYPDAHADLIADNCMQIKMFRDKAAAMGEPGWYASLQVVNFCVDGPRIVHEWSKPHASYTPEETDRKIFQIASMGPTSCETFKQKIPAGCDGCRFAGTITSPIQLGNKIESVAMPVVIHQTELGEVEVRIPEPPVPFKRAQTGLFLDQDGVPVRFYRYDLFPMGLIWDDADAHMTVSIRHHLPQEGWQDFPMPASALSSQKDFDTLFTGKGVFSDQPKTMKAYMSSYLQSLQASVKMQRLYDSLGWKDETDFVFGPRIFKAEGVFHAGFSRTVPETVVRGVVAKGDLTAWVEAVSRFTRPGLEAHLFSICTGFGSPLLHLTGFAGCMLSMLGQSNAGKTLASRGALTIYGKFEDLQSGAKDTMNARMERLHAMKNLPVYFDELTNIDPKELSNLVYMLSQGRGREKLRSDSTTRAAAQWSAIALGSTNRSMYDILSQGKDNAEAEMMRVLEIWVPRHSWFEPEMTHIFDAFKNNYGLAGPHYIKHIVASRNEIPQQIRAITDALNKATGFEGKERFWSSLCACVLYGFISACKLGLIRPQDTGETFNRLFNWVRDTIIGLRGDVQTNTVDSVAGLGQYINHHQAATLVVYPVTVGGKIAMAIRKRPTRELIMRVEEDTNTLWIDRKHLKSYLGERSLNFDRARDELVKHKILIDPNAKKMLGSGTNEFRSSQIPCWKIDLNAKELSGVVESLTTEE